MTASDTKESLFIAIDGPAGSGKSSLATRVRKLNTQSRSLRVREVNNLSQILSVIIAPDAKTLGRNAPFRSNRGRLRDHHSSTAASHRPVVHPMPLFDATVLLDRSVLAHGRHPQPIPNLQIANPNSIKQTWGDHGYQPTMNAEVARVSGCAKLLQKWNTMHPSVVWFREDLRVADNPALSAAAGLGNPIVALFVLDEESEGIRPLGAASRWWLHHSLETLAASLNRLGIELVIRRGAAASIVTEVARSVAASHVLWNRRYGAAERALDSALKQALTESGVVAQSFQAGLLNEPWTVETLAGKPFSVFTPYYRACLQRPNPRRDMPVPENAEGYRGLSSERLADWKLLPQEPDWAQGLRERWQPGEQGGQARLQKFLEHNLVRYAEGRDIPGETNTSELSAHLRWGEVSPFQVWHRTQQVASADPRLEKSAASFLRELGWREFSYNLLYHWPDLATKNFNAKFDVFPWRNTQGTSPEDMESARALQAWKRGETGIPLVDAGMRELWQTGFMHNRVRMVAASFLTKNLLIDWRVGEQWFWDTLVDADPANNAASWQWVAGSGADAAPYFRVFNPELQASKFDPKGVYVQRWVPEIANGEPLTQPIVDLKESRNRALAAYQVMSDQVAASS